MKELEKILRVNEIYCEMRTLIDEIRSLSEHKEDAIFIAMRCKDQGLFSFTKINGNENCALTDLLRNSIDNAPVEYQRDLKGVLLTATMPKL